MPGPYPIPDYVAELIELRRREELLVAGYDEKWGRALVAEDEAAQLKWAITEALRELDAAGERVIAKANHDAWVQKKVDWVLEACERPYSGWREALEARVTRAIREALGTGLPE